MERLLWVALAGAGLVVLGVLLNFVRMVWLERRDQKALKKMGGYDV